MEVEVETAAEADHLADGHYPRGTATLARSASRAAPLTKMTGAPVSAYALCIPLCHEHL